MPDCARCNGSFSVDFGDEPTKYCHDCAHERVGELESHPVWLLYRWARTLKRTFDGGVYRREHSVRCWEDDLHYLLPRFHGSYWHPWGWLLNVSWLRWYAQVRPRSEREVEDSPYVCPGCYAVGGERCAEHCVDARLALDREEDARFQREYGDDDDDDVPL